ncbi:ATP-binding protein [Nakamurella aerolata]|uniref:ATP-binding protein n=1 Tax=Nakamurella aerolata TaxID=1656892 RepID=A0A849AJ66_9ACTN|nr:ATP-binding protein [Nakamurella aerolata]NNG36852.1 ATP-binding protein [Nakamurella aerolata]
MDPIRNPYAPGAGQRPPELAGRDEQLATFDVVLQRVSKGRPERSMVLTGLRGVGKTVLLNSLRSAAVRAGWGTGKLEARPDQRLRRPIAAAAHTAVRELGHPAAAEVDHVLGTVKAFALRDPDASAGKLRDRWSPGIDAPATSGRADSGDIEIDLLELLSDIGGLAADLGQGVALFIDEMQDLAPQDVSALCAACHELSQAALPVIVVGAGLPHLPAVLSASKSYSERLFRYSRIDRLDRTAADKALSTPASDEDAGFDDEALAAMYAVTSGYPYFVQAYGKAVWDQAPRSPITAADVAVAAPLAEEELAVGFFGSRYERATPAEREYLRAMADVAVGPDPGQPNNSPDAPDPESAGNTGTEQSAETAKEAESVSTADVAALLGKKPQSLSPARDALLKKGLIYSGERGRIAFTVPHFGRYLRTAG